MCAFSSAFPPLMSTPWEAPFPVATIIAVGVARPKAHGQATTSTEIPNCNANSNHPWLPVSYVSEKIQKFQGQTIPTML